MNLTITSPSIVRCGAGKVQSIPAEARRLGVQPVVVTGRRLQESHLIRTLLDELDSAYLAPPVTAEPTVDDVDVLAEFVKSVSGDTIIAIGGGSVIDAAKAAAVMVTNEGVTEDYQLKRREITNPPLPQVVAPTTAGTGSEATRVSVLTNHSVGVKRSISHPLMTPNVVILDPELTLSLPLDLTTLTAMDAFSHAIESAVSRNANAYTHAIALAGISELIEGLPACQRDLTDLDARQKCLVGACFAGLAMQAGMGASHSLAPAVCVARGVPHSVAVAALLPHSIRLNERLADRIYEDVKHAMGCEDPASRLEELCAAGGVDIRLSSYGFDASDWPRIRSIMNRYASHRQTNPVEVTDDYAQRLFEASVGE